MEQPPSPQEIIQTPERMYKPCVVIIQAPPYHGKSTAADSLKTNSNFAAFDIDEVKRELFGKDSEPPLRSAAFHAQDNTERTNQTYAEMVRRAVERFNSGSPTILSGTFSWDSFKAPLVEAINSGALPKESVKIFFLDLSSEEEIEKRIKSRDVEQGREEDTTKRMESYRWSRDQIKPWPEGIEVATIDANIEKAKIEQEIAEHLKTFRLEK